MKLLIRWTVVAALLAAAVLASGLLLWWVAEEPRLFFAGLLALALSAHALALLLAWTALSFAAWRTLPATIRSLEDWRGPRFSLTVLACAVFFVSLAWVINRLWLPSRLHPLSLLADTAIAVLTVFLWRWLLQPRVSRGMLFAASAGATAVLVAAIALFPSAPIPPSVNADSLQALTTLPYLSWVPGRKDPSLSGVVYHDPARACPGLNLCSPDWMSVAQLMTNSGDVVHEWTVSDSAPFEHFEVSPNGDLLVILQFQDQRPRELRRLAWDSSVVWRRHGRYHHEIFVAPNHDIYTMVRWDHVVPFRGLPLPVVEDYIEVISPDGQPRRRIHLFPHVEHLIPRWHSVRAYSWLARLEHMGLLARLVVETENCNFLAAGREGPLSLFHANSIHVIKRDVSDTLQRGTLLFCIRNMDLIGLLDPSFESVVFLWGPGTLQRPHHPRALENGNVLVYDNGSFRGFTRVLEIDVESKEIVWEYKGDPPDTFFSATKGSCQRLPNGNTLIANSNQGQVFEVTRDGEVVWEYHSPLSAGGAGLRATIYRMNRVCDPGVYAFLNDPGLLSSPGASE